MLAFALSEAGYTLHALDAHPSQPRSSQAANVASFGMQCLTLSILEM
jgi:hypothetical protein